MADTRLRVFAFPQSWSGGAISLRVLVAPSGNPLQALDPELKPFAQANIVLSVQMIPGLAELPRPAGVTATAPLAGAATAPDIEDLYNELASAFHVDPAAPPAYAPPGNTRFLKMLMPSYRASTGFAPPRTEYAVVDNRYVCAIVDGKRPNRPPKAPQPPKWDSVLAMALRQPVLARGLGLIYSGTVTPSNASLFENGGWLYVTLDSSSDYFTAAASPDFLALYAARIPPLSFGDPQSLFAPVLFRVRPAPPPGSFDEILKEAELYGDGFARLVHAFQADRADYLNLSRQDERRPRLYEETGLRIGWDDEQVVIWLNRQLTDDPRSGSPAARDTPMGVRGFRVDVRDAQGPSGWSSLVRMKGPVQVGAADLGQFDGEMAVELAPSQLQGVRDGEYWLPPYFALWTGGSLIAPDATTYKVANATPGPRVLKPVGETSVPLKYGREYQFRVRLTDLTGGGPGPEQTNDAPDTQTRCRFRRFVPPGPVIVEKPPDGTGPPPAYTIRRPLLGHPAVLYTHFASAEAQLLADIPTAKDEGRPPGLPDPDVTRLRIDVKVASLEFDPGNLGGPVPRQHLYTTFREFDDDPAQPIRLAVGSENTDDIAALPAPASTGPLKLPSARTVEITFTPVARKDPGMLAAIADPLTAPSIDPVDLEKDQPKFVYFGNHSARLGKPHSLTVRKEATAEASLFADVPGVPFQGIFIQPDPPYDGHLNDVNGAAGGQGQAPENAIQRLARQLRLLSRDLTLCEHAGVRVVFGASAALRHVLSPDHSTIVFSTLGELTSRWILAVPLVLARDWTWDGLAADGFEVFRSVDDAAETLAGVITPRQALSDMALRRGVTLDRSRTEIFFFDAIDPKPQPGEFPRELKVTYRVSPKWRNIPQAPVPEWKGTLELPMAAKPTQTPRIVSAGMALTPYERDITYSQTAPRHRVLWVEFAEPVANPRDAYFARVTMHAPDPMLTRRDPEPPPGPLQPPLSIDPEPIRSITANQPRDTSGLDAMQRLIPAQGSGPIRHFLVPLPDAIAESSSDLFGFFTYDFAVGHAEGWSTAQARFGLVHRVTGVQHPAPALSCSVARTPDHVRISAPYALATAGGQIVSAEPPNSDLWGLLYVQVQLADASSWRNILIGRTQLRFTDERFRGRSGAEPQGLGYWDQDQIELWLDVLGLPRNSALSVLAAEMLPELDSPYADPLGKHLGQVRVLRVSPLTPVPAICLDA